MDKCNVHDKEMLKIKTEFGEYKTHIDKKLDEIIDSIKPQFTSLQITAFLFSLLTAMVISVIYVADIKSDGKGNTIEIRNIKEKQAVSETQYANIVNMLMIIQSDVAVVKSKAN